MYTYTHTHTHTFTYTHTHTDTPPIKHSRAGEGVVSQHAPDRGEYLREASHGTADGGGVAGHHTPVHQGRCELGRVAHVVLLEGQTLVVQP